MVILTPFSVALVIYALIYLAPTDPVAIASYGLSAYALVALCFRTPRMIRFFRGIKQDNRYLNRYFSDVQLRVNISLYGSLIWNTAYAIFQLGLGFYHHTVWYYSLAGYYIVLAVMRFFLLKHSRKNKAGEDLWMELLLCRFSGLLLIVMNLALGVVITYIVLQGKIFIHHEITTIAMAAYTFTSLTMAIFGAIRYRRYESPVYSSIKTVSLAAALVSLVTLTSTMLTTFGEGGSELFRLTVLACVGFFVTVFVLIAAIRMIRGSTKQIRMLKESREN